MSPSKLTIVTRKYDGTFRFRTEIEAVRVSDSAVIGLGHPGRPVLRGSARSRRDDWSLEYLPLHRPYNIVSFFDLDGRLKYHFCNVLMQARLDGDVLSYIDLDLDVVVTVEGEARVEDREEFEHNAGSMRYPGAVRELALGAVDELLDLVRSGGHVFGCRGLDEARERLLGQGSGAPG